MYLLEQEFLYACRWRGEGGGQEVQEEGVMEGGGEG